MFDAPPRDSSPRIGTLVRSAATPARLSALAILGLAAGSVPLPFLPPRLLTRIRGAVVHDVAGRHGLSLTQEARKELSRASLAVSGGALLTTILFFVKRSYRRLGAMGIVPPLSAWLEVYALGLLLDRYFDRVRSSPTVRIDAHEARNVRRAIDRAVRRSFSPNLHVPHAEVEGEATEDLRDMTTRLSDGFLLAAAALPMFLRRRLEAALDAVLAEGEQRGEAGAGTGGVSGPGGAPGTDGAVAGGEAR